MSESALEVRGLWLGNGGRIAHGLRHRWRDGTTHVVFTPLELIEKLVALVPRPRAHVVRYHGVPAPHARDRPHVVDFGRREASEPARAEGTHRSGPESPAPGTGITRWQGHKLAWADLMRRVFELDVLECPDCGGRMRVIAAITAPGPIAAILNCLGLATRPPPLGPARPRTDPRVELFADAEP